MTANHSNCTFYQKEINPNHPPNPSITYEAKTIITASLSVKFCHCNAMCYFRITIREKNELEKHN